MSSADDAGAESLPPGDTNLESIVAAFEDAWSRGERPLLDAFLPPEGRLWLPVLVELVHADLENRLKLGQEARVETYLKNYPELLRDAVVVQELIAAEYRFRQRQGSALDVEEYRQRFPQYSDDMVSRLSSPPSSPRTLVEGLTQPSIPVPALPAEAVPAPPAAESPALRVTFTVVAGPHQGKVFEFEGHDTFLVGRSKQAHFRLPQKDEYFSRVHFVVEVNPPHCRLMDMGSTNGTYVNGERVGVADLRDGDLIQGGQTVVKVSVTPIAPAAAVSESTAEPPEADSLVTFSSVAPVTGACPACAAPVASAEAVPPLCKACAALAEQQQQTIPGFRLIRELGRGGMGVVYQAVREADASVVALKTIRPTGDVSKTEVERFLREANILRQLQHPHVVAFREMGEASGRLFLAMDYVKGTDASKLVKADGPLEIKRAVVLVCQMLEALAYAHGQGFVHRDVKPGNLLVTTVDGREVAQLADFGLARVYQASRLSGLTIMGQMGGTVAFMAPEQVVQFRDAQPPADQYAAAATLYYLLSGRHIFDFPREQTKRLLMVLQDPPVPLRTRRTDVPEGLEQVIHQGLEKEAPKRFAGASQMRERLLPWAE
jgi:serine/threonine-protein kinase